MTIFEILEAQGVHFDVIQNDDGTVTYKTYTAGVRSSNGVITSVGKYYNPNMIIVGADGISMNAIPNPDYGFIEDKAVYASLYGLASVDELLGLTSDKFYAKLEKLSGFTRIN